MITYRHHTVCTRARENVRRIDFQEHERARTDCLGCSRSRSRLTVGSSGFLTKSFARTALDYKYTILNHRSHARGSVFVRGLWTGSIESSLVPNVTVQRNRRQGKGGGSFSRTCLRSAILHVVDEELHCMNWFLASYRQKAWSVHKPLR